MQLKCCGLFWAAAVFLFSGQADAHRIDLRRSTSAAGETEISFCARPSPNRLGFPGHAFVAFSQRAPGGARTFRAVGHTVSPAAGDGSTAFTYFGGAAVAGQQAEERYSHIGQDCLLVMVDRADFDAAVAAARPTLTRLGFPDQVAASLERYSLNENDCVDFVIRVARTLRGAGLSVPDRSALDRPLGYVGRLQEVNSPR